MTARAWPRFALPAVMIGWLATCAACAVPPERSILEQFFAAARLRDTTILKTLATTPFEPLERGIITEFEVENVARVDARRKIVTISAPVHGAGGARTLQRLAITLEQGIRHESEQDARRWIVTKIEEAGR